MSASHQDKSVGSQVEDKGVVTRHRRRGTFLHPQTPLVGSLKGRVVGFVPPWWADSTSAWFTSTVFEGVSRWADQHDCHISVLHADAKPTNTAAWEELIRSKKIEGLVWVHPQQQQIPLVQYMANRVPTVVAGRHYSDLGLHHVVPDYAKASQLIDDHMVSLGHEKYAVIGTRPRESYSQAWIESICETHAKRGVEFNADEHFIDITPFDRDKLAVLLREMFEPSHSDIQAYVLTSSSYLIPLIADEAFQKRIGKEISIVSVDFGLFPIQSYWPGRNIDHVACNWPEVGQQAIGMLNQLVAGRVVPEVVRLPVEFVSGQSATRKLKRIKS